MKTFLTQYISKARLDRLMSQSRHWLLLAFALSLTGLFLKLTYNILYDPEDRAWIQIWDNRVLLGITNLRFERLTSSMIDITALGSATLVTMIGIVFFCVFLLLHDYLGILQLTLASMGAGLWTIAFKYFAERPRPSIAHQLVSASGYSFPSGHSLSAAALYITFATMAGKHIGSWKRAAALQGLAGFVIACVAFSRVYLGVHYPSDVIIGALFGAAWAYFVAGLMAWIETRVSIKSEKSTCA